MKRLTLLTLLALLAAFAIAVCVHMCRKVPFSMKSVGKALTYGESNAPIEFIFVEDPKCKNCLRFHETILPKLMSEYIDTKKARLSIVEVEIFGKSEDKLVQKNLEWAEEIMGAAFRVPMLYINGEVGSTLSFDAIQYQVGTQSL